MDDLTPEQEAKLEEAAGPVGAEFAQTLTAKVTEAVSGFPSSTADQRVAIAALIANGILNWATEEGRDYGEGS